MKIRIQMDQGFQFWPEYPGHPLYEFGLKDPMTFEVPTGLIDRFRAAEAEFGAVQSIMEELFRLQSGLSASEEILKTVIFVKLGEENAEASNNSEG